MPRRPGERCDRREALALLESERTVAAALAVRAIAEGWDNGRLGNGPEQLPREREVLGLLGVAQGLAAQRVSEASESLTDVLNRAREVEAAVTAIRPLDELVEEFALSKLARTLLSLVAAPAMWGEIAQLYAIVADEPRRAVDEHLLRQLLGPRADPHAIAHELDPQRPLRRFGLLQMATAPRPFAGLLPHPLVLARLRAEVLAEDPERELDLVTRAKPVAELRLPPSVVEVLQTELAHPPARPFRIVVRGREGSGRRALLAALARLAARDLAIVHADRLGDQLQPSPHHLRRALERCTIAGWIPCIDGVDAIAQQDGALAVQLRQVLAEFPGPLAVRLDRDARPPLEAGYLQIDLPELTSRRACRATASSSSPISLASIH